MAIEFIFGILESVVVDFLSIFERKLDVYCWVANIFDSHILLVNVIDWHFKIQLQLVYWKLLPIYFILSLLFEYLWLQLSLV